MQAPAGWGRQRVAVRRLDLGASTSTLGWAQEETTSTTIRGGATSVTWAPIDTRDTPAPGAVYRSARRGSFDTTFHGLLPRSTYAVRLHLLDDRSTAVGQRTFDVLAGGVPVAAGVDIVGSAGAVDRATTRLIPVTTDAADNLALSFRSVTGEASVASIEVLWDQPARQREVFSPGTTTRVMAMGDSITQGVGDEGEGGYRFPLWQAMSDRGWSVTPVGPQTAPPYSGGGPWQGSGWAGWSGWLIDDLLDAPTAHLNTTGRSVDDWLTTDHPDVILLNIGSNDLDSLESQDRMRTELTELLDRTIAKAPDADVLVAQILNVRGAPNPRFTRYNETVADLVMARSAAGAHVHLVDLEPVVNDPSQFWDSAHPNAAGYHRVAQAWLAALEEQDASAG